MSSTPRIICVGLTLVCALGATDAAAQPSSGGSTEIAGTNAAESGLATSSRPAANLGGAANPAAGGADVAFNLGLEYANSGELGRAILWMERAHRLAPFDRELQDVLTAAHGESRRRRAASLGALAMTQGEPPEVSRWRFFGGVPRSWVAWTLLASAWGFAVMLYAWRRSSPGAKRDALFVSAILAGFVALNGAGFLLVAAHTDATVNPAVVLSAEPTARNSPDELSRSRREPNLYEGAVVLLGVTRGDWVQVVLVDGKELWVSREIVEPVLPR